jgi:hypothetical protein
LGGGVAAMASNVQRMRVKNTKDTSERIFILTSKGFLFASKGFSFLWPITV